MYYPIALHYCTEFGGLCVLVVPGDPYNNKHMLSMAWDKGHMLSLMILPQVHLRKPCYDFYFL